MHPTKMEIRFSNQNLVYDLVERTVKDALSGKELIPEVTLDTPARKTHSNADIRVEIADEHIWYAGTAGICAHHKNDLTDGTVVSEQPMEWKRTGRSRSGSRSTAGFCTGRVSADSTDSAGKIVEDTGTKPTKEQPKPRDYRVLIYFMEQMRKTGGGTPHSARRQQAAAVEQTRPEPPTEGGQDYTGTDPTATGSSRWTNRSRWSFSTVSCSRKKQPIHHVIIGQLFDTYWLVQYADKLYIIDQHAAHEKVLYERLMKDLRNRTFQSQLLSVRRSY